MCRGIHHILHVVIIMLMNGQDYMEEKGDSCLYVLLCAQIGVNLNATWCNATGFEHV